MKYHDGENIQNKSLLSSDNTVIQNFLLFPKKSFKNNAYAIEN